MLRFLAAAAACLAVSAAAAEDMPGLATLSPPDAAVQAPPGILPQGSQTQPGRLGATEPAAGRPVADLRAQAGTPRPWCTQERRVGTGAGFCLIN